MSNIPRRLINRLNPFGYVMVGVGVLLYIAKHDIADLFNSDGREVFIVSLALIAYGSAIILLNYLRGNRIEFGNAGYTKEELKMLRNEIMHNSNFANNSNELKIKIENIEEAFKKLNIKENSLTEEEKLELTQNIKNSILSNTSSELLKDIEEKYSKDILFQVQLKNIQKQLNNTQNRLKQEISALSRRGNVNLVIGVITTMIAVWILATTMIDTHIIMTKETLLTHFAPRLTLSLFIEIFSFFFLRLYKTGLNEIKYFQNELTNIEMKFISLEGALHTKDKDTIHNVINEFSKTERNFILEKGQSTVEIERTKLDASENSNSIASLSKLVDAIKK